MCSVSACYEVDRKLPQTKQRGGEFTPIARWCWSGWRQWHTRLIHQWYSQAHTSTSSPSFFVLYLPVPPVPPLSPPSPPFTRYRVPLAQKFWSPRSESPEVSKVPSWMPGVVSSLSLSSFACFVCCQEWCLTNFPNANLLQTQKVTLSWPVLLYLSIQIDFSNPNLLQTSRVTVSWPVPLH